MQNSSSYIQSRLNTFWGPWPHCSEWGPLLRCQRHRIVGNGEVFPSLADQGVITPPPQFAMYYVENSLLIQYSIPPLGGLGPWGPLEFGGYWIKGPQLYSVLISQLTSMTGPTVCGGYSRITYSRNPASDIPLTCESASSDKVILLLGTFVACLGVVFILSS